MKFLDLFSGIGGFRLGLERSGHTPVGYVEIDKFARQSYQAMYNTDSEWTAEDINKVTDEEWRKFNGTVELIAGGFPCQSFSIAGKREGFLNQTKGTLFFEVARAVKQIKPRFVFLENVKGLLNHDKGNTLKVIINTMNELGYYVNIELVNSKNFGVPQNRERIYILCSKADELTKDGLIQNLNTSKSITESYLLGLLQKNLTEAKKLQGHKSKEWVLNYLVLKDMVGAIQKSNSSKSTLMTIKKILQDCFQTENGQKSTQKQDDLEENTTLTPESLSMEMDISSLESTANINLSIEELLKKILEENLNTKKLFTILISINKITTLKTYMSLKTLANILSAIEVLQKSYQNYWQEILLNLTLVQENTKYAKISDYVSTKQQSFGGWINGDSFKSIIIKKYDIIGHLRGDSGREVFPFFGEDGETNKANVKQVGNISDSNSFGGNPQTGRVYSDDGLSPTLNTMQGGGREPKVMVKEATKKGYDTATVGDSINISQPNSKTRRGRVGHGIANTLVTGSEQATLTSEYRIRKLTPRECWRLQAFPDELFDKAQQAGLSDSQLYKQAGNSVTVNVIEYIGNLLKERE
ncbi:DNA (cytosine-5-)-methyltransferase [Leuconostoc citreum]|nr:DNA (cytosine-5-)-methyltransferase [Leuconostoc citreum]MCT3078260.1 DNA (cytosine-5-)-methyltransferase [Leuconostoc citreum]MCT3080443.1 DNA (cytosine-5-)-methyltransferase [Leuconostoc citreum]MCT3082870.1 DNA (cytosine-5-)-methyltransferase [Leuconostoc citreum]